MKRPHWAWKEREFNVKLFTKKGFFSSNFALFKKMLNKKLTKKLNIKSLYNFKKIRRVNDYEL